MKYIKFLYLNGTLSFIYLSPIFYYFVFTIFYVLSFKRKIKFNKSQIYCFILFFLSLQLLIYQKLFINQSIDLVKESIRIAFPLLFCLFISIATVGKDAQFNKSVAYFIYVLFISSLIRVLFALLSGEFDFYNFKYDSIFYPDSNFEGYFGLMLFFWAVYNNPKNNKNYLIVSLTLLICLLSFSRSIWIVLFAYVFYKFILINKLLMVRIMGFLFLIGISILGVNLFYLLINDGSMQTKLYLIIDVFGEFLNNSSYDNIFFGVGSGQLINFFDRESHNLFGLIVELGVLYIVIYVYFFYRLIKINYGHIAASLVIISSAISLFPIAYMGLFLSILLIDEKRRIQALSAT